MVAARFIAPCSSAGCMRADGNGSGAVVLLPQMLKRGLALGQSGGNRRGQQRPRADGFRAAFGPHHNLASHASTYRPKNSRPAPVGAPGGLRDAGEGPGPTHHFLARVCKIEGPSGVARFACKLRLRPH